MVGMWLERLDRITSGRRIQGVSAPVWVVMLLLALVGITLARPTDGRSWAVLAPVGLVAVVDCLLELRRHRVAGTDVDRAFTPVFALAGILAGLAFIVVGVLVAAGVIDMGG